MLEDVIGAKLIHIPYKGGGPATNDLLGGTVDFMFDMVPASLPYLKAAPPRMRALAAATDRRLPQLPPTCRPSANSA
jgi:tripartite-type tricarboxylate transporter receptor subunit TctC